MNSLARHWNNLLLAFPHPHQFLRPSCCFYGLCCAGGQQTFEESSAVLGKVGVLAQWLGAHGAAPGSQNYSGTRAGQEMTDRKLLLKTAFFLPLRGRNALCWQQAWSFHHGEALNKRFSNTKLFAEVIINHRAESQKVKARFLPSLRANEPSVCSLLYLFKCHKSSFLLHLPILLMWAANKTCWKADCGGSGQNPARCKEGEDVRAIQDSQERRFLPCW